MSKITKISPQIKHKDRFSIFLNGKFAFGTTADIVLKNNLKVGQSLDKNQLDQILAQVELSKLFDRTLHFLSYRPRSQKEIQDYLTKKIALDNNVKFSQAVQSPLIDKIILKLKKYNYINDHEFAKWFIASRSKNSPKGKLYLKFELLGKGIDPEIINELLQNLTNELEIAKKSVAKKIKFWKNLPPQDFKKKFYSYLMRRGFPAEIVKELFAFFTKRS